MAAEQRIILPYAPRRVFLPYHARAQRWSCIVAHRRCGKTVACINDMIKRALMLQRSHGRFAYVAPFLAQAKEVAWEYLKRYAAPIITDKNEGELWVELLNGARVRLHGADNPDRLRGNYLDGVVLDEFGDMRPSIWGGVIRPMLADRSGWATFIGTPKGRNDFAKVYERSQSNPDWFSAMFRASQTGILGEDELVSAGEDMTPEQYEQEFECSFDAAIMGAYFGKEIAQAEREGRIRDLHYDPELPVHTSWDLGIGDPTAIWFWQITGSEIRLIDHYENTGQAIPHYVKEIQSRNYKPGVDWVPHDAKVRSTETGRTRLETLRSLGRDPWVIPDHTLMDGINSARLLLPRCYFDRRKCAEGIEALRQYRADFDEKAKTFKDRPRHDWASHSADAFRYMAMGYKEIVPDPPPKTVQWKLLQEATLDELWEAQDPPRRRAWA
jgi:phage terminase large subunit